MFRVGMVKEFLLLAVPCAMAGSGLSGADLDLAIANLQRQILQEQLSSGVVGKMSLPNAIAPSISGAGLSDPAAQLQLTQGQLRQAAAHQMLPQQQSTLTDQLELASQRLAVQQRLAALQLQQARMLDDLGVRPESLALPQTQAQSQRQKNPALAALLAEPAMYGYYLILWAVAVVFTAISSAICMYFGKLPFRRQEELPSGLEAGRRQRGDQPRAGRSSGRHSMRTQKALKSLSGAEPDEEPDGVETWIRVPVRVAKQYQGYVDESDGEGDERLIPPRGRNQPCGYADEC